jgi:hypothetical protein
MGSPMGCGGPRYTTQTSANGITDTGNFILDAVELQIGKSAGL